MIEVATAAPATAQAHDGADIESVIKGEVLRMYQEVAEKPDGEFHFYHGRQAAEMFGYELEWLDRAPAGAVASFAGVGNPHARSELKAGETVLDLGSGAGLDSIIASWQVGSTGRVIGVDLNPTMCIKAQAHAEQTGSTRDVWRIFRSRTTAWTSSCRTG
jgi:arsenite methyltransferase